jgi:hypothetical protein
MRSDRYLDWQHAGNGHGLYGAAAMVIFAGVALGSGLPGVPHTFLTIPVAAFIGFAVGKLVGLAVLESSGRVAQSVYAPTAAGTYTQTHSNIDAMEVAGDYKGAVAAWEAVAVSQPGNPWPLMRAGELYLRVLGEPEMALDRFRLARDVPGITPEQQRYASQKVIDLYLGPFADEGRAMVELRRLIDQHPGTPEAAGARTAIQHIKSRRGEAG